MINKILADFYKRDLNKLIEELNLFKHEENIWRTQGSVSNSAGNLVLHLVGGLNYLIGAKLGGTGYVRNRDNEFIQKHVSREELISKLEELISIIDQTLNGLDLKDMDAEYPMFFDKEGSTTQYVSMQLLTHLNYHLGQVNYIRRGLE